MTRFLFFKAHYYYYKCIIFNTHVYTQMYTQRNMKTLGNWYEKVRNLAFFLKIINSLNYCYVTHCTTCLRRMLFFLKNRYIYFHEVAILPHLASSSLPSPTVGHVGACKKALAWFLWFEPGHFRRSKPPTLRAGRQKLAVPTPNSEVQDCKPWQPAAIGCT